MQKKVYIFLAFLPLFWLAGCVDNLTQEAENDLLIRLGAKVEQQVIVTKAAIDRETEAGNLDLGVIRWDESDNSWAVTGRDELEAQMGDPAGDGTWRRNISVWPAQYFKDRTLAAGFAGWYPSTGWELESGNVIHSDRTMTYAIDGETDVMVSDFVSGTSSSGLPSLQFRHALCMYNIYVYTVDEETKAEWGKVNSVVLRNLPTQLVVTLPEDIRNFGEATFDYNAESQEYTILGANDSPVELPVGLPSQAKLIKTVLGGKPLEGYLGIRATSEKQTSGNSVSIARNFAPGYTYNIFLRFSSRGIVNAEVSASDWQYFDNYYELEEKFDLVSDMSRYGTSNCYIISSANRSYCFDATVKGNGVNTLQMRDGTTITLPDASVNLNPDHVGILWSDALMKLENGSMVPITDPEERRTTQMIELVSDKLSDGKVLFKVKGKEDDNQDARLIYKGNVVIAAYDANDNIIWSWHLWITDNPTSQGYGNGYKALDRNLGAVDKNYSSYQADMTHWSGLYYQWGRKDPIFRGYKEASGNFDANVVASAVSTATAHANPTTYYYSPSGNNWTTDTSVNDHFWGYVSIRDDVEKTIYDPCPRGYRVADNPLWNITASDMVGTSVKNSGGNYAGYDFNIGHLVDIWYPATDIISGGDMMSNDRKDGTSGEYVWVYSATPYQPDVYGHTDSKYDDLAYHFRYADNTVMTVFEPDDYYTKRSDAYPVRCVSNDSEPVITDLSENQTANSYVVSKTGYYKFRADVRGNGVTGVNAVNADDNSIYYTEFDAGLGSTITNIDRVDVLWWQGDLRDGSSYMAKFGAQSSSPTQNEIEEACPVTILDGGSADDGYAVIHVNADEDSYGNVGIAAYDINGNILWSWHIWIRPTMRVVRLGDFTLMDRNLGATYAPDGSETYSSENVIAGYGFLYQWGRKDPFFQPFANESSYSGTANTAIWYEKTSDGWVKRSANKSREASSNRSISDAIANPLEFFKSSDNWWQTTYNTAAQSGRGGSAKEMWGYVGRPGKQGESFAKTMWDPCPPGYRIMQHNAFGTAGYGTEHDEGSTNVSLEVNYAMHLNETSSGSSGGTWLPNTWSIAEDGNFDNEASRLSTSTPYNSAQNAREIRWYTERYQTGNWWNPTYGYRYVIRQEQNALMSEGRVVRCQME